MIVINFSVNENISELIRMNFFRSANIKISHRFCRFIRKQILSHKETPIAVDKDTYGHIL